MAMRPQNLCKNCKYTWYPKGRNVSAKCPQCGSRDVQIAPTYGMGCCLVFVVGFFALAIIAKFSPMPAPKPDRVAQPLPTQVIAPTTPEIRPTTPANATSEQPEDTELPFPPSPPVSGMSAESKPTIDLAKQAQGELSAAKKLIETGRQENAIPWLKKAIEAAPDSPAGIEAKKLLEKLGKK